jgi:hypothetical protein
MIVQQLYLCLNHNFDILRLRLGFVMILEALEVEHVLLELILCIIDLLFLLEKLSIP